MKLSFSILAVFICLSLFSQGCSVAKVAGRGEYIDQESIAKGTPRKELLARFGAPLDSRYNNDGVRVDIFRCEQGERTGLKVVKSASLLAVGILTLGISEAVATPVTSQRDYVTFEVTYNGSEQVKTVNFLTKP